MMRRISNRFSILIVAAGAICIGLAVARASLPVLIDQFMVDDAFYYNQIARNFARTNCSTFDGIHSTNGYQPLWFLVCVMVFRVCTGGGDLPIWILLAVQVVLYAGASVSLFILLARLFDASQALIALTIWFASTPTIAFMGLETALLMLMLSVVMNMCVLEPLTSRKVISLGIYAGLLFLARTDMTFVIIPLAVMVLFKCRPLQFGGLRKIAFFLAPLAMIAGTYVLINLIFFGHVMPVSGAAKLFHSHQARLSAVSSVGYPRAILGNLNWIFSVDHRVIVAGIFGPLILLPRALHQSGRQRFTLFMYLWPFSLGSLLLWLFYSVFFHGPFTVTSWYYSLQIMLASLTAAALPDCIDPHRRLRGPIRALIGLVLPGLLLSWGLRIYILPPLLAFVLAGVLYLISERIKPSPVAGWGLVISGGLALGILYLGVQGGPGPHIWIFLGTVYMIGSAVLLPNFALVAKIAPALFLCAVIGITTARVDRLSSSSPGGWNYNLYLGAMWARENLPPGATIWSDSTGVLGYFSGHPCVNTDGLVNDFDYLENYLKAGRKNEYLAKWDYSIDAMADESLKSAFPSGEFIRLPEKYRGPAFQEGPLTRQLRVYRMNAAAKK